MKEDAGIVASNQVVSHIGAKLEVPGARLELDLAIHDVDGSIDMVIPGIITEGFRHCDGTDLLHNVQCNDLQHSQSSSKLDITNACYHTACMHACIMPNKNMINTYNNMINTHDKPSITVCNGD